MPKNYIKKSENLKKYSKIEIYQLILNGKLDKFPNGFWSCVEAKSYAPKIVRYLLEEHLKWSKEDIKDNLTVEVFLNNKLGGLMHLAYNNSPYKALCDAYGSDYLKPWELRHTPTYFWRGEDGLKNAKKATKWLFQEKLKWSEEDIKNNLTKEVFIENGLGAMLWICYKANLQKCINAVFPNTLQPNTLNHLKKSRGTYRRWNEDTSREAVRSLIEDKLKWDIEDIKSNLTLKTFIDNNLSGLMTYFNGSPYKAINSLYPNKIKPWELKTVPRNYWNKETYKLAINWLVYDKLKWTKEYAKDNLTQGVLIQNNFTSILKTFSMQEVRDLID